MAMSGIKVNPSCKDDFEKQKLKKNHKAIFYNISPDGKEILKEDHMDSEGDEERDWEKFKSLLSENKAVYCTYDFHFSSEEGHPKKILMLITWCPDNCPIKMRMMTAATKEALKSTFSIGKYCYNASELSDLDRQEIINKFK